MTEATKLNWIDEHQHWRILKWNGEQQKLEIKQEVPTKSTKDLQSQLVQIRKNISEETLHRFRSTRKLVPNPATQWVQFQIEISLRVGGDPTWAILQEWVGQAAWPAPAQGSSTLRQCHGRAAPVVVDQIQSLEACPAQFYLPVLS